MSSILDGYWQCIRCDSYTKEKERKCGKCGRPRWTTLSDDPIPDYPRTPPKPEQAPKRKRLKLANGPAAETPSPERVHLRVVSVRKRLCDPDNLVAKWHIDCLRYCRIIADDTAQAISLETSQRKASKGEAEHTRIEIIFPEIERAEVPAVG